MVVVRLIVFLSSVNLIRRSTDISKCLIESLGVRDNESRLYSNPLGYECHTGRGIAPQISFHLDILTLAMLNKLSWHAHFLLSANQIA